MENPTAGGSTMPYKRIYELDIARSIALFLMIIYHTIFDLAYYYKYNIEYTTGFWYFLGKISAVSFMFISGITSTIVKANIRRGFIIFCIGLIISLVTYCLDSATYIRFGILHLLGIGAILYSIIARRLPIGLLFLTAIVFIVAPFFVQTAATTSMLFIPLGFLSPDIISLDYYPLIPWYGIILLGNAIGKLLYKQKQTYFPGLGRFNNLLIFGRYTLLIYLIHQPIIISFLFIIHKIRLAIDLF